MLMDDKAEQQIPLMVRESLIPKISNDSPSFGGEN
jgi:hypothetical protein